MWVEVLIVGLIYAFAIYGVLTAIKLLRKPNVPTTMTVARTPIKISSHRKGWAVLILCSWLIIIFPVAYLYNLLHI